MNNNNGCDFVKYESGIPGEKGSKPFYTFCFHFDIRQFLEKLDLFFLFCKDPDLAYDCRMLYSAVEQFLEKRNYWNRHDND